VEGPNVFGAPTPEPKATGERQSAAETSQVTVINEMNTTTNVHWHGMRHNKTQNMVRCSVAGLCAV
jgi:FtsP/CotA-like multicopper oxidase with cupredoxin domain